MLTCIESSLLLWIFRSQAFSPVKKCLFLHQGNSGFETAQHLQGATNLIHMMSRGRLRLSWETHYVGDVRYFSLKGQKFFKLILLEFIVAIVVGQHAFVC